MSKFWEHTKRSILKTVTYRVLIITTDAIIIMAVTHRLDVTLSVIIFSNIASTIVYFGHERIWNKISWGRIQKVKA